MLFLRRNVMFLLLFRRYVGLEGIQCTKGLKLYQSIWAMIKNHRDLLFVWVGIRISYDKDPDWTDQFNGMSAKGVVVVAHLSFEFKRFMHLLPVSFFKENNADQKATAVSKPSRVCWSIGVLRVNPIDNWSIFSTWVIGSKMCVKNEDN